MDATRLRVERARQRLTLSELAEKSGVSMDTISFMERGRSKRPRGSTIAKLAEALDIPVEELLMGKAQAPGVQRGFEDFDIDEIRSEVFERYKPATLRELDQLVVEEITRTYSPDTLKGLQSFWRKEVASLQPLDPNDTEHLGEFTTAVLSHNAVSRALQLAEK